MTDLIVPTATNPPSEPPGLQPMITGLMNSVPVDQVTGVSTLFSISQRVGASLGIAALAGIYYSRAATHGNLDAFQTAAWVLAAIPVVSVLPALLLPRAEADRDAVTVT